MKVIANKRYCTCYNDGLDLMAWYKDIEGTVRCMKCNGAPITDKSMNKKKRQKNKSKS